MPRVDNHGTAIAYRVQGRGEPLVLLHGWSGEGRYWDEFGYSEKLGADFKLIVPDLRGHGASEVPADRDFSVPAYASDVIAVMDDLRIDSAHLLGYSLGGWLVFELAARFPSRARSAIVAGAHPYAEDLSPLRTTFTPAVILEAWEALRAPLSEASKQRIAAFAPKQLAEMIPPDLADQSKRLESLPMPFLAICGTNDWRFEEMRRFAAGHGRCEFVALAGLDHLETWQRSDLFVPPLQAFLQRAG